MPKPQAEQFGWHPVPRNRSNIPSEATATTIPIEVNFNDIWPQTDVVKKAQEHVRKALPQETYNHSLRVYCYGSFALSHIIDVLVTNRNVLTATTFTGHTIVTQHLPSWIASKSNEFFETWALTCLFHDTGTTPENRDATHMSFEFQGGFMALQQLQTFGAPKPQAESVCEAIIRHQDPGESGSISQMGQLVQLATEFDNMGFQPHLIHQDVIGRVVAQHPRLKWSSCFSTTIEAEIREKPWCHTTALEGFAESVSGNKLMEPYD